MMISRKFYTKCEKSKILSFRTLLQKFREINWRDKILTVSQCGITRNCLSSKIFRQINSLDSNLFRKSVTFTKFLPACSAQERNLFRQINSLVSCFANALLSRFFLPKKKGLHYKFDSRNLSISK